MAFPRLMSQKEQAPPAPVFAELESFVADQTGTDPLYESYKALMIRVTDAFGDQIVASRWLSTPSVDFGSQPPIRFARSHGYDVAVLEPVLIRIEHGVDF